MSVKLRKRKNSDGTTSLILDIYNKGERSYEFLKHLQLPKGNSEKDRQTRKENETEANFIRNQYAADLERKGYDLPAKSNQKVIAIKWMEDFAKKYKHTDIRVIDAVIAKFKTFLTERKKPNLLMKELTNDLVKQFRDKLSEDCVGEGGRSYFSRFKRIIRNAYDADLMQKNPCIGVDAPKGNAKEKDVLTFEELQTLANTATDAIEVKRAFLFCSLTGLRFIDAKLLTWDNIDLSERLLEFKQSKTKNKKGSKPVIIPLNDTALSLLGEEKEKKDLVFELGSAAGCNKSLQAWVDRTDPKINKSISWHCARHGFGTNLIFNGVDIYTVSKLLGHTSLKHTQRYVRASQELNKKAIDSLPKINFGLSSGRVVESGDTFSASKRTTK